MYKTLVFESSAVKIVGRFYSPDLIEKPLPTLVIAPGFGSTIAHTAAKFAEEFSKRGFNAFVFDNPGFGESEGAVRQEADPILQRRAIQDAITLVSTLEEVDDSAIGLWGSSYAGGHAIQIAAYDRRIKCIVAQVPAISGYEQSLRRTSPFAYKSMLERLANDRRSRFSGEAPQYVTLVSSNPNDAVVFPGMEAYEYYTAAEHFVNKVTLRSLEYSRENEPGMHIARVSPTPMLMIVADSDTVTPTDIALRAFNQASEPKKLTILKGGHFSPYVQHFDLVMEESCNWFGRYLT